MDLFENKNIKPMLIGAEGEPFDSKDYVFELKLDGERCIAYLDDNGTELRNKRNMRMLPKVPELKEIHKQVKNRCILDGELIVIKDGKPDFYEIQRRSLMTNQFKIELAGSKLSATFVAYDILWLDDEQVNNLVFTERRKLLEKVVNQENERFAISRYIEENGIKFFELAKQQELEGIVAKRKDSKYYFDKRTKDWIKIKYLQDDDFVVCGYIQKDKGITSIVLGQYRENQLIYKGHVTMGVSGDSFRKISSIQRLDKPPYHIPSGNENAIWIKPSLVCTVKYMMKSKNGSLRQPVFKGLREDKLAEECKDLS